MSSPLGPNHSKRHNTSLILIQTQALNKVTNDIQKASLA